MATELSPSLVAYARTVLGQLPLRWDYAQIGQLEEQGIITDIQDGNHGERHPKSSDYVPVGVPFVMAKDLSNGRIDFSTCSFITPEQAATLRIGFARPGDVLLTHKATMGRVAIVPNDYAYVMLTPQVTYYRIGDPARLDALFLRYAFLSPAFQRQLTADSDQSTRQYIGITAQRRLWIPLPPPSEQQAIAHILGALDDKIELNRRMNETLEAMARALFKSWFVDFDPVHAKAEGRQPVGMDARTAALFPDEFEESRLGLVPTEWQVHALGDVVDYLSRGIQPTYVNEGGIQVINQKCIRNHQIRLEVARRHNPDKRDISGRELALGDVLVNSTGVGTLGRVAQVEYLSEPTIVDSHVTVIRANADCITPNMLGLMLLDREAEIEQHGEGSTGQTELSRERLRALTMLVPPLPIQHHFDELVTPIRARAVTNQRESHSLAAIRDLLLPKLLSGEIQVKDAEKLVEAAV